MRAGDKMYWIGVWVLSKPIGLCSGMRDCLIDFMSSVDLLNSAVMYPRGKLSPQWLHERVSRPCLAFEKRHPKRLRCCVVGIVFIVPISSCFLICVHDAIYGPTNRYEEISGGSDEITIGGRSLNARAYCSWYNFNGGDQQKKVGSLSGGERNRLQLAKVKKQDLALNRCPR